MASWVMKVLTAAGYPGLAALAALECIFPPIPSELIFPLAGYISQNGRFTIWGCILAGAFGGTLGALPLYYLGRKLGAQRVKQFVDRHGRWAAVSSQEVERARLWFDRHGGRAVLIAHLIPGMRSLISLPAGVDKMPLLSFLLFTAIGSSVWVAILVGAGYALGAAFGTVQTWLDPVSWVVLGGIVTLYVWRVVRGR